ncbi:UDP-glycosyltransferase 92A1 isoform X2 [Quercus suber]|uniref:UDP-glycosyltransferase 92A1 isoform X2 n=1 Tax=Quercus suber TaxID=58331 RepID=UPI000D28F17F|nr:udp-glycosyltransferase 92a1 [Quercus suber]
MGSKTREYIVMLPFLAQGHLIPFLALARQIHQRTGYTITIANTPLNIKYLRSTILSHDLHSNSSSDSNFIHLAELPFCSTQHGLPPNTENTENLSLKDIATLCHASMTLEAPFHSLVRDITDKEGKPPLCIISDVFFGWAVNVANSIGCASITFTTCGAYGTSAYISFWLNLPHRFSESDEFALPGFPDRYQFRTSQLHPFVRAADGTDTWSTYMQPLISYSLQSHGWLCNTVEEFEPLGLEILRKYIKLPVWTIGPLLPSAASKKCSDSNIFTQRTGKKHGISPEKGIEWLNLHHPGLEASGKPFIWVLRPPLGFDIKGEFREEWLPEGFEKRMNESKQGLLVQNWAPQLEILSHESIGAFLSHCGWNSVLESLSQGVPIIGWPMAAEQIYNSKMLVEEMGVCVELTWGVQREIERKEVKRVIDLVMNKNEGQGKEMKKKADEIGKRVRAATKDQEEGSSVKALDEFLRTILAKTTLGFHNHKK